MECMILGSSSKPCLFSSFPTGTTGERSSSVKLQHFSSLCSSSILTSGGKRSRRKVLNARERLRFSGYQQHSINHSAGKIKESLTFLQKLDETFAVNATSEQPLESGPDAYSPKSTQNSLSEAFNAFYRFSRPHTIIGTTLSIISVSLLAVQKWSDFSLDFFTGMLAAIVAALLMNIYIVGLNQLADIEIDKVNKPYLPLASGEYSLGTGIMIIASSAIMSFFLGWVSGSRPLCWALLVSFLLGTAYSINFPLLRWKRFAVIAASCIVAVRAVIVQLAFYLHVQCHVYKRPAVYSKPVIFATAFMSFFSVVIALFKDIPDITGDMKFGIQSFSVKLGQERVFWICISLLQMAYAVAIVVGASSCNLGTKCITILGHFMLASILWIRAKSIDLKSPTEITSFYMFIWKLFYAEYFLIPLVR